MRKAALRGGFLFAMNSGFIRYESIKSANDANIILYMVCNYLDIILGIMFLSDLLERERLFE